MEKRLAFVLVSAAVATAFAPPLLFAATHCVNPTGAGACQSTIQAAIDLAAPGDTVRIARGTYYEAIVVGPGKDGLQIVGAGPQATILDGSPFADRGFAGSDTTLSIGSPYVRVRNLGFRNGVTGILVGREHVTLQGLEFRGTDSGILVYFSANTEIIGNAFYDGFSGVVVQGTDLLARGNLFEREMTSLSFWSSARPDRPQIIGNRLEGVREGLGTSSVIGARVLGNVLRSSGGLGASGLNPVVDGNTLLQGGGLWVSCTDINLDAGPGDDVPADCTTASVSRNRVEDANTYGLVAIGLAPTMVVRQNVILRTEGAAMNAAGTADFPIPLLFERNTVDTAGFRQTPALDFDTRRPCYAVFGVGATLSRNTAAGCADQGFLIRGGPNVLEKNRVTGAGGSGFMVDGVQADGLTPNIGVELRGNVALRNAAQGIAVRLGATQTQIIDNVATGNRTDYCDEGTFTGASGNTFGTTGVCTIDR